MTLTSTFFVNLTPWPSACIGPSCFYQSVIIRCPRRRGGWVLKRLVETVIVCCCYWLLLFVQLFLLLRESVNLVNSLSINDCQLRPCWQIGPCVACDKAPQSLLEQRTTIACTSILSHSCYWRHIFASAIRRRIKHYVICLISCRQFIVGDCYGACDCEYVFHFKFTRTFRVKLQPRFVLHSPLKRDC